MNNDEQQLVQEDWYAEFRLDQDLDNLHDILEEMNKGKEVESE